MNGHKADLPLPGFDKPVRILIVVSQHDGAIAELAQAGAMAVLSGLAEVEVVPVPGVLEISAALALAERLDDFDGYVALGAVTGNVPVWAEVARALSALGLGGALNGNGVIFAMSRDEALAAADGRGKAAAEAVLHLVALSRRWANKTKGIGFRA